MILSADEFVSLRLSDDPDDYRRAIHEEAADKVWLDVLSGHPDMKIWVVRNKTVPLSILRLLSDDPDGAVRYEVACKRKLDEALFEKLSHDRDASVRHGVAYNKKAPLRTLKLLSNDTEQLVSRAARERLKQP